MRTIERIGSQTLILGDAKAQLACGSKLETIITDPPYGVAFQSNYRSIKHRKIQSDHNSDLLKWTCLLSASFSKYIWMRWDNLAEIPRPKSVITWVKNNWSMGDLKHEHGRQTEVCAFYPGECHRFASGRPADVLHHPITGNNHHPTEKPVGLMIQVINWTSGHIMDPFMGCGSTLVAAERLGRPATGIEIDPEYFKIACARVEKEASQLKLFRSDDPEPIQESLLATQGGDS